MDRHIEYMSLDLLVPHPKNPKKHDLDGIRASINRLGFIEPIVMDERTGQLISGHGRSEALAVLSKAGDDPPDGVNLDDSGSWLVPVTRGWSSTDADEAEAAVIALNRWVELGGWQNEDLADALERLSQGPGLLGVGYTGQDVTDLLALVGKAAEREAGFLNDLVGDDRRGMGADEVEYDEALTLSLVFTSQEDRATAMAGLKKAAKDNGLPTMAQALLHLLTVEA